LPPSAVLEILRILKAEIDLRNLTRVAKQQREVQEPPEHREVAEELAKTQRELEGRTKGVIQNLEELQRREKRRFGSDLARLHKAKGAMADAADILSEPNTGAPAIAAETEAIETLLATRRGGGGGGGGGGSTPGGSTSGGSTDRSAIALIGLGAGEEAESRVVKQASGATDVNALPAEYRGVLDAYFGALEGGGD